MMGDFWKERLQAIYFFSCQFSKKRFGKICFLLVSLFAFSFITLLIQGKDKLTQMGGPPKMLSLFKSDDCQSFSPPTHCMPNDSLRLSTVCLCKKFNNYQHVQVPTIPFLVLIKWNFINTIKILYCIQQSKC